MEKFSLPPAVEACRATLLAAGHQAYPVGGCVRDLLLGRLPGDWDMTTSARPEEVVALFDRTIPTGLAHGTVTVVLGETPLEVTTFRREGGYSDGRHPDSVTFDAGLSDDLARRDFTINALALAPDGAIVDPFGGQADLTGGVIRCVGNPDQRFGEDALRMLRALRFAAQLGFTVEDETAAALVRNAPLTEQVSAERKVAELDKTLRSPHPARALEMAALGLLTPWLKAGRGGDPTPLEGSPPTQTGRWRAFCALTGLDITALPVSRALRRAVLHPEVELIKRLALTGGELCGLGLKGPQVGAAQRVLAAHIGEHPADNTKQRLTQLLQKGGWG